MSALLFMFGLFLALTVASALGWTVDSREQGDWAPSVGGFRQHR